MKYTLGSQSLDSVELKCLLVSRGLKISADVYKRFSGPCRLYPNALTCNCLKLPDGTIAMATDLRLHLSTLSSMFSWDNLKLFKYMGDMKTNFRLALSGDDPVLLYEGKEVCEVSFLPGTEFFKQKTGSGMPFLGNAVLQGCNWVAFQCLWPCEYALAGKACQYCFSGGQFEALARRKKPLPRYKKRKQKRKIGDTKERVSYLLSHTDGEVRKMGEGHCKKMFAIAHRLIVELNKR